MAVDNTRYDVPFRAPALPYPPQGYDQQAFEEFNNVLRLYFNQLDNALRNAMAVQEPYELQVSKGQVAGASSLYKFGYNPDINGTEETIWSQGGDVVWPAAAFTAFISSSSTADTIAGTGAQTVTVQGLDENYATQSVTVDMNGQTQVQVGDASGWIRINRAFVATAGSGGTAAGTVYIAATGVSSGVPTGTIYASITDGNQTQMAVYTVPASHTLYLDDLIFTAAISQANNYATVKLNNRDFGSNVFRTKFINVLQSNELVIDFEFPLAISEKTDIECRAVTSNTNNQIGASFQGVLLTN
jgi:hypothetical protein